HRAQRVAVEPAQRRRSRARGRPARLLLVAEDLRGALERAAGRAADDPLPHSLAAARVRPGSADSLLPRPLRRALSAWRLLARALAVGLRAGQRGEHSRPSPRGEPPQLLFVVATG